MNKVAVDIGSGYTKYYLGPTGRLGSFKSLSARLAKEDTLLFKPGIVSFCDSEQQEICFCVGEECDRFTDPAVVEDTLNENWYGSHAWLALLYKVLSMSGIEDGPIRLVTGLPVGEYRKHKERIEVLLTGRHVFSVGSKLYDIEIAPLLYPQALASLYHFCSNEFNGGYDLGVIDIGTYTTGFGVISKNELQPGLCGGMKYGVSNLKESLEQFVSDRFGQGVDSDKILNVLKRKRIRSMGHRVDIHGELEELVRLGAFTIFQEVRKSWSYSHLESMRIVIAGGGGNCFLESLDDIFPNAFICADPFYSVVKGFWELVSCE